MVQGTEEEVEMEEGVVQLERSVCVGVWGCVEMGGSP